MKGFRSLIVWQKAHQLALDAFCITKDFPSTEQNTLTAQLRSASLSIPTNIAEGTGRKTNKERAHFFNIAMGSAHETEYLLIFSSDYGLIANKLFTHIIGVIEEIKSMLFVLMKNQPLNS